MRSWVREVDVIYIDFTFLLLWLLSGTTLSSFLVKFAVVLLLEESVDAGELV